MASKLPLSLLAPAKVNMTLNVIGKRNDGYHLLHSIIAFAKDFGDTLTIKPSEKFIFTQEGACDYLPHDTNENLIVKTAQALADKYNKPLDYHIHLTKNIPIGAGLGGGSSNAAHVIKALLNLWEITPNPEDLNEFMLSIGADIPVCYYGRPCIIEGIGDIITPIKTTHDIYAVLIYPNEFCSTIDVFKNFNGIFTTPDASDYFLSIIQNGENDLTTAAIKKIPAIGEILQALLKMPDCKIARMTGSGSCCFGIFDTAKKAQKASNQLQKEKPHWWVRSVSLGLN